MDNTEQQQSQLLPLDNTSSSQTSNNFDAAALSFATMLSESMLRSGQPTTDINAESPTPASEEELDSKIETKVRSILKEEMGAFKDQILSALDDENGEES